MLAAAVYEDGELNFFRTAKIHKLVHRGPDRASGVKHIIDEDDRFPFDVLFKLGAIDDRICTDGREIVTVERDVEDAVEGSFSLESLDLIAKLFGKRHTTAADADQIEVFCTTIILDDLCRKPTHRTFHLDGIHYPRLFNQVYFVSHSMKSVTKGGHKFKVADHKFGEHYNNVRIERTQDE